MEEIWDWGFSSGGPGDGRDGDLLLGGVFWNGLGFPEGERQEIRLWFGRSLGWKWLFLMKDGHFLACVCHSTTGDCRSMTEDCHSMTMDCHSMTEDCRSMTIDFKIQVGVTGFYGGWIDFSS